MCRLFLIRIHESADLAREAERNSARGFFGEDYHDYVERHGHHFTPELAEYVCYKMRNADDSRHSWTCTQVKETLDSLGIKVPDTSTIGDMTYSANMAYADFYPLVIKDVPSCVLYARSVAEDPDGYEGLQFYRWLADIMATNTHIDWNMFV